MYRYSAPHGKGGYPPGIELTRGVAYRQASGVGTCGWTHGTAFSAARGGHVMAYVASYMMYVFAVFRILGASVNFRAATQWPSGLRR